MDPLSIATAAVGLIQNVVQVVNYLKDVKNARKEREGWIKDLEAIIILLGQLKNRLENAKKSPDAPWYRGFLAAVGKEGGSLRKDFSQKNDVFDDPNGLCGNLQARVNKLNEDLQPKHGIKGFLQRAVHTIDKVELTETFDAIRKNKTDLDSIMQQDHFELSLDTHKNTETILEKLTVYEDRAKKADIMNILKWLSPLEFLERQRKVHNECFYDELHPPGQWLMNSEEFVAWKSGRSWPLYCYGNPGAGKTVLSAIIIKHLEKHCKEQPPDRRMAVLYLYLNHKETKLQTISNLTSSLLKQLIQGRDRDTLSDPVKELFENSKGERRPDDGDVCKVLRSEILTGFSRVYIVVDALDELPEESRPELLAKLENIMPEKEKISLMVTSRAFEDVSHEKTISCNNCGRDKLELYFRCKGCTSFDLCQTCKDKNVLCGEKHDAFEEPPIVIKEIRAPDQEIKGFVMWELDKQRGLGRDRHIDTRLGSGSIGATMLGKFCQSVPDLIDKIPEAIVSRAQGMYLLAKLHMESLRFKRNPAEVRAALKVLPTEVGKIYEDILKRIDAQRPDDVLLAKKVLAWAVLAHRPLSVLELLQALAVKPLSEDFNHEAQTDLSTIKTLTLGLITADADRGAVRLVHRTAQEHFTENREMLFPTASDDIAVTIMTCLNFKALSVPCEGSDEDTEVDSRFQEFPFFAYASTYWGEHIQEALNKSGTQNEVREFLKDPSKLASTIQAAWYIGSKSQSTATWDVRNGVNGLHVCAWYGLDFAISTLLNEIPDLIIDSPDQKLGQTPLIYACRRGHSTTASKLLENGADINIRSKVGSNALFESILGNHQEVLSNLLTSQPLHGSLDVNVTHPEHAERTPLMLASFRGYEYAVDNLLQRPGIEVNCKDSQGWTALTLAIYGKRNTIVKKLMGSKDLEFNATNTNGATPLIIAADSENSEIVEELLKGNANPNIADCDGNTAILVAVKEGCTSVVRVMLNHGVATDGLDKSGRTLLHVACTCKGKSESESKTPEAAEIVRLLLSKGLKPDAQANNGVTPLHDACRVGRLDVIQILLHSNADQSIKDLSGRTPLAVAKQHHKTNEIVQFLLDSRKAQGSTKAEVVPSDASLPLWSLAKLGHIDLARKQVKVKGCNLSIRDPDNDNTALHWAVEFDHFKILEMLLDAGMSPDDVDDCGRTALHLAAELGDNEATERLLQSNANLDLENRWGATPLSTAQSKGNYLVAVSLIAGGACIDKGEEDEVQATFFEAVRLGRLNAVQLLIKRGADVQGRDKNNQTALQLAKASSSNEVLNLLKLIIYPPPKTILGISADQGTVRSTSTAPKSPTLVPSAASPPVSP